MVLAVTEAVLVMFCNNDSPVWWDRPTVSATWKTEAEVLLEPRNFRLAWAL